MSRESVDDACVVVAPQPGAPRVAMGCEHASQALPAGWSWSAGDRWVVETHWAWDIGAETLAREVAKATGVGLVAARFSRLLIDPNRAEDSPTLIRTHCEGRELALNRAVDAAERARRLAYYRGYHDALAEHCEGADLVFAVHSFTPSYEGEDRPYTIGVLFDDSEAEARALAAELVTETTAADVRLNEPYSGK